MIQFSIDSFSNGITGRPYKSINEAIQDGSYSVWCNEKIKLAFSFGNGTEKDFNTHSIYSGTIKPLRNTLKNNYRK